jgi:5'-nucleotidase
LEIRGGIDMAAFTTILFDLDDTLFDFAACWEQGMRYTIATHPLTADLDGEALLQALQRRGNELWVDVIAKRCDFTQYRQLRLQRSMADMGKQVGIQEADDFQRMYAQACMDAVMPDSLVQAAIAELSTSYTLGIVTNGPADMAFIKLSRLGLSDYFPEERVFLSERIGHHKPDRRIYEEVLTKMGVSGEQVLFVGDTWEADVAGPIDAGMQAIWVNPRQKKPTTDHQPLAIIERLDQILQFV